MKKFLLCLILLLLPLTVSAQEVEISDFDLKISLDDDWYVFTRDNISGNTILEESGVNTEDLMSFFKTNDVYMDALPTTADVEFFILVKSTPGFNNLSNYPDEMIENDLKQSLIDKYKASFNELSVTTTKVGDTKYFVISYYDAASKFYIYNYYTVINAKGFNFQLQKQGEFNKEDKELLNNIVSTVKVEIDPELKNETKEAQKEIEEFNNRGSKNKVLIFVIIGVIVGMVIFAVAATNKKQA